MRIFWNEDIAVFAVMFQMTVQEALQVYRLQFLLHRKAKRNLSLDVKEETLCVENFNGQMDGPGR